MTATTTTETKIQALQVRLAAAAAEAERYPSNYQVKNRIFRLQNEISRLRVSQIRTARLEALRSSR